jgi:hypothetical protein
MMEITEGSTAHTLAILAMDRAEALDKTTVQMQALVRKELLEMQAVLRKEAAELQAMHRKEAAALEALRQEVQRSVQELKALQTGIERSAGTGVRNAVSGGIDELRQDLNGQISDSVHTIGNAAQQVKGMVRRLTPLWVGLIAAGGLLLGIVLMYFFVVAGQRRIEEKLDQLLQPAPVAVQSAPVVTPPPVTGSSHVHQKTHGSQGAVPKPKTQQEEPAPPVPDQQ